jgi:hypothetical protein
MPTTRSPLRSERRAWRRPAVLALHDLDVGAAHADRERLDEHGPALRIRLGNLLEARAVRLLRLQGDGLPYVFGLGG